MATGQYSTSDVDQAGQYTAADLHPDQPQPGLVDRALNYHTGNKMIDAPLGFLQGAAKGAIQTLGNAEKSITTPMAVLTGKPTTDGYADVNTTASGVGQGTGKFAEQAAEYAIPSSMVGRALQGSGLIAKAAGQAGVGAAVSAMQGGSPTDIGVSSALGAAGPLAGSAVSAVANKTGLAQRLYQSALKPTWSMVRKQGLDMLDTGLKEQIPVSHEGLSMVEDKISNIRGEINQGLQSLGKQGVTIDSSKVLSRLGDLEDFYKNTAAPGDALDTLQKIRDQFTQFHGQQIPIDQAQKIKINTYQELRKSYGEMASAKIEGLKQVARGIKEEISTAFPEIQGLNERQSKLLDLDDALYRAVWRIENHQMMGIGSPLAATAGHALMGGPGAVAGLLGKFVLDDPTVKSKLALGLAKAGAPNAMGTVSARMAALHGALQESVNTLSPPNSQGAALPAQ